MRKPCRLFYKSTLKTSHIINLDEYETISFSLWLAREVWILHWFLEWLNEPGKNAKDGNGTRLRTAWFGYLLRAIRPLWVRTSRIPLPNCQPRAKPPTVPTWLRVPHQQHTAANPLTGLIGQLLPRLQLTRTEHLTRPRWQLLPCPHSKGARHRPSTTWLTLPLRQPKRVSMALSGLY